MKVVNFVNKLFKEQPVMKEITQTRLFINSLTNPFLQKSMQLYASFLKRDLEEQLIENLIKYFDEKGNSEKKLKAMTVCIQIFKQSKYDLSEMMANKKIKIFTKSSIGKVNYKLCKQDFEQYILHEILVPLYHYLMKLSLNQDLYKHCLIGKIPDDEIFRRGTKIRFIWIFKIYNLIYLLIPIVQSCVDVIDKFPDLLGLLEICHVFYKDMLMMNNFVIQALEEGSEDNFILMPYFDMLQFYESLTQQRDVMIKINQIFVRLLPHESIKPEKPRVLNLDPDVEAEIETQAVRVKLISCTIKNPKKDHSRLVTQYEQQLTKQKNRLFKTEMVEAQISKNMESIKEFQMKYRCLQV